jgi:hypothetical protein
MKEAPFKLRCLVQDLGGLSDDDQKMAWHDMKTEARADYVLALLQHWDRANPGAAQVPTAAAAPAPAPQRAPAPAPQANGAMQPQPFPGPGMATASFPPPMMAPHTMAPLTAPQVAPVSPAAIQQAQQATAEKPKRQPKTASAEAQSSVDIGIDVLNALNSLTAAVQAQTNAYELFQKNLGAMLTEAATTKASRVEALETQFANMRPYFQSITDLQTWTLMAFLTFMQESMNSSPIELLRTAINDSAMFQKLVERATSGKV